MVCKLNPIIEFVRQYKLLEDLDDEAITEIFHSFPHCCSWDKGLGIAEIDSERIDLAVEKILEVLNDSYEHQYTEDNIRKIAISFLDVFSAAGAPVKPVPFVIVILARI